ncbi:YppE family protein [Bacillus aquiflavi]|uniref:YppE family protein n=1 Tax=Bacillus aquiflavi TaxID=2672567 RepID=A0A6B3VY90_9BACI|nr:YppE family protein [Bacillus aquiflavi]MBA4536122.1 YppE family protein [Bacillus aquiflavi]NEY80496.1 YppE family protein [Bacillus aquiflavi]UAC47037.1 YppE family protein [Bacillus aquiflavi]
MVSNDNLKKLTNELLQLSRYAEEQFEQVKSTKAEVDFLTVVKPFVNLVKGKSEIWAENTKQWIIDNKPRNVHVKQIDSTVENLQLVSVQAFFPSTSRTRFINYIRSIDYVLNSVLKMKANPKE